MLRFLPLRVRISVFVTTTLKGISMNLPAPNDSGPDVPDWEAMTAEAEAKPKPQVARMKMPARSKRFNEKSFDDQARILGMWIGGVILAVLLIWGVLSLIGVVGSPEEEDIALAQDAEVIMMDLHSQIEAVMLDKSLMEPPADLLELCELLEVSPDHYHQTGYTFSWNMRVVGERLSGQLYAEPLDPDSGKPWVGKHFSTYGVATTYYGWDKGDVTP